jgi:hypothetical protein
MFQAETLVIAEEPTTVVLLWLVAEMTLLAAEMPLLVFESELSLWDSLSILRYPFGLSCCPRPIFPNPFSLISP